MATEPHTRAGGKAAEGDEESKKEGAGRDDTPRRLGDEPLALWRRVLVWLIPTLMTVGWAVAVQMSVGFARPLAHWQGAVTMIFGSFLAGSSPEGGGSVAFPVFVSSPRSEVAIPPAILAMTCISVLGFINLCTVDEQLGVGLDNVTGDAACTKVLHTPAPVARTFTLAIQAFGMTVASSVILLNKRPIEAKMALIGIPAGAAGFYTVLFGLSNHHVMYWPSILPPDWVKLTFSLCLATMSFMMIFMLKDHGRRHLRVFNARVAIGLAVCSYVGGGISCLTGTGVNVTLFLFTVVLCDLSAKVAIPTTILVMTCISVLGFINLCIVDEQLDVGLDNVTGDVIRVGRFVLVHPEPAASLDLLGLWLAAVPVVVWGAPFGTVVVHHLRESVVVGCVAVLAATEVVSTFVLEEGLHSPTPLLAYGITGLVVGPTGVLFLRRYRFRLLGDTLDQVLPVVGERTPLVVNNAG